MVTLAPGWTLESSKTATLRKATVKTSMLTLEAEVSPGFSWTVPPVEGLGKRTTVGWAEGVEVLVAVAVGKGVRVLVIVGVGVKVAVAGARVTKDPNRGR